MWKAIPTLISGLVSLFWLAERLIGLAGLRDDFKAIVKVFDMIPDFWGGVAVASTVFFTLWWLWPRLFFDTDKANESKTSPVTVSPVINPVFNINVGPPDAERPFIYDKHTRTVWFGTDHGDMEVRFIDADTVMNDINRWLADTGQRRTVSGERIKRILYQVEHNENISIGDEAETAQNSNDQDDGNGKA